MDVNTLAAEIVKFLAPFLPLLVQAGANLGKSSVEAMGEELGETAWKRAKSLWARLRGNAPIEAAARDVALLPDDADAEAALRLQVRKLLAADTALSRELASFSQSSTVHTTAAAVGERSVAVAGPVDRSLINTGDVGVPVKSPRHPKVPDSDRETAGSDGD